MTEPAPVRARNRQPATEMVLDILDVGVVACDAQGRLTMFNRASRELHGAARGSSPEPAGLRGPAAFPDDFDLYDTAGDLLPADQVPLVRALRDGTLDAAPMVIAPQGRPCRTVLCSGRRMTDDAGATTGAVVWMRDVTGQQESLRALVDSERLFRTAVADSPLGFAIADATGQLIEVNPALCRMLGFSPGTLLQQGLSDSGTLGPALTDRRTNQPDSVQERRLTAADGRRVWVRIVRSAFSSDDGADHALLQIEDITERRRADDALRSAATLDPLTNLPNRAELADRTQHALAELATTGEGLALLFVDLDNFKKVNDRHGHELGDSVLAETASRLGATLRVGDVVARLGGDEFVLLCRSLDPADHREAQAIAERVVAALARPYRLGDHQIQLSASVGIAFAEGDRVPAATLLARSDAAMYAAKRSGKSRYATYTMGQVTGRQIGRIERLLRQALDGDQSGVAVHYQPVVDLESGLVIGTEALARLSDGEGGMLPPVAFIPVAERTGLINELGLAVLEQAVRQVARWKQSLPADREFGIGVNLSVRQLADPHLVRRISHILNRSGLPPDALILELTESVFSDSDEHAMVLRELNDLGPRVIIDDFGTGCSSLSYLRRFPVDGIKIDRSFVTDLAHDARDRTVTGALIGLARDLGVPAIAEGIETMEQLTQLRRLGCPLGQGYLLSRPVPAEAIAPLLRAPFIVAPTALVGEAP